MERSRGNGNMMRSRSMNRTGIRVSIVHMVVRNYRGRRRRGMTKCRRCRIKCIGNKSMMYLRSRGLLILRICIS